MGTEVLTGVDQPSRMEAALAGKRFGLLTNPTGINRRFESTIDVCAQLDKATLTALFACEHGIRGQRQAGVLFDDELEEVLGIPIYSLYGSTKRPTPAMLDGLDAIVYDIQDLGVRFYTYLTTLIYMLEACAKAGKGLIVVDRPNPLGGVRSEGGLLEPGYESMIGSCRIPLRSGLTIGETALYVNAHLEKPCELTVIPMLGWTRGMEYPDTGLPWLQPSPNMPTMNTVRVYAGTCLFEGTNVSEGRGTTRPFEFIGAPWMDGVRVSKELNQQGLPGVYAHPLFFTPTFSKHQGELCSGVQLFVHDPSVYNSVGTGLRLLECVGRLHLKEFEWLPPYREGGRAFIDLLTGSDWVRTRLLEPGGLLEIEASWSKQIEEWQRLREPFLLYGE